jgi:hypothetical protein
MWRGVGPFRAELPKIGGEPHWRYQTFEFGNDLLCVTSERSIRPRLPLGAQPQRVEHACTPGRRVYPCAISATIVGVDARESYNAECNARSWSFDHFSAIRRARCFLSQTSDFLH